MATITAEATAADLLAELRELVGRFDGAETLDDVRQLADEVTQRLRRARGRIARLARQVPKTETPAEPPAVAEPKPATEPAAEPAASPAPPAAPVAQEKPPESAPAAVPVRPRPAPRRITTLHVALAVIASLWSTATTRTGHATDRAVRAVRSGSRRAAAGTGRLADAIRRTINRIGGAS